MVSFLDRVVPFVVENQAKKKQVKNSTLSLHNEKKKTQRKTTPLHSCVSSQHCGARKAKLVFLSQGLYSLLFDALDGRAVNVLEVKRHFGARVLREQPRF